jgi:hypothetical protein
MTNSTDSLERFVTAVRTDLKTWSQLLPFRQSMPAERPSRDFVVAVFVSLVIHAFLAHLLWVMISGCTAVEPTAPTIDTPLILSLSTFTTTSHEGMDLEVVPAVPHTEPPAQRSQSSPEPSRSAEHKSEAETDVTSKDQGIPGSEVPEGKYLLTDATLSFDLEAFYSMDPEFERMSEFKAGTVVISKGQGVPDSEAPEGKSLASYLAPSFGLEAFYRVDPEFIRMSEFEFQYLRRKRIMLYLRNYIIETRASHGGDCRTVYAGSGLMLLAIPFLIKDAITGNGCKWYPEIK